LGINIMINYDAFGNVIASPETEVLMTSRATPDESQDRFVNYLKRVEGVKRDQGKTPFRYASPEGGTDTIGIGHKLTDEEVQNNSVYGYDLDTLTQSEVDAILRLDLLKYRNNLDKELKSKYNKSLYDLDSKQQEMLLDFKFNLGSLGGFPKFTKAVLAGDTATMKKEYKRYFKENGVSKEVKDRNEQFFKTYLQ